MKMDLSSVSHTAEMVTCDHKGHMYYNPSGFYKCTFSNRLEETLVTEFSQQVESLLCDLLSPKRIP